jgi:asparagine synthase (glutamine-hydrolysing)
MCGIAGIVAPREVQAGLLGRMSSALRHRGPDGTGLMRYSAAGGIRVVPGDGACPPLPEGGGTVGFAHRRLAIIDLSEANGQPMLGASGATCLVFNGEIYNYRELRRELERHGHRFRTTGDTEVLLAAYETWGPACLRRLNGMWAFALLDAQRQRVLLSRDRFGIKPLYTTVQGGTLYFASEIKALLAVPGVRREPDERTVSRFLLTGLVDDGDETFFAGISQLPAGHLLEVPLGEPHAARSQRYWDLPVERFRGSDAEAVDRFRELFVDAVRLHMRSDVPVGTCLSGGLDSSSIVCAADLLRRAGELSTYTHHAFGYRSPDPESNEAAHMDRVATAAGSKMHYVDFDTPAFVGALPEILRAQDEPFGSASIAAQWFVFREARAAGMKVMLDGQGADETLGGYHAYFVTLAAARIAALDLGGFRRLRAAYEREIGPFPMTPRLAVRQLVARWAPPLDALLRRRHSLLRLRPLSLALTPALNRPEWLETPSSMRATTAVSLRERLQEDVRRLVLPALLRYEDRNSMAHSLEARVPFLDHRLVEFAFSLPDAWKVSGITTKAILRQAMAGILPEATRTRRDKIGFRADPRLTAGYITAHRHEILANHGEWEQRWFRQQGVEALLDGYDGSVAAEFGAWRLLNVKLWARQFWG